MTMINNDLSTDLRLGLSISSSSTNPSSCSNMLIRNSTRVVEEEAMDENCIGNYIDQQQQQQHTTLFVKVYMEGIPIGRKLDLHAHHGYHGLITALTRMFRTTILYGRLPNSDEDHVLTYEDKDGDLMMVGDVPWEVFLTSVKRLRITRRDKC